MGSNSANMSCDEEEAAFSSAMQLSCGSILPMVLKAAIELDLLELIKKAGQASASELAAQLPTNNPDSANMIDRMLRLLAAHSIVTCSRVGAEPRYGLTPVSKYLTRNEDGVSLAAMSLLIQDRAFIEPWYHLKDAVLGGGVPFDIAHGMNAFEYPAKDPRFNEVFNQAMYSNSTIVMKKIVETYKGFEGLSSLVDVGGGIGASVKMIISKYPSIKAINFDLPHVIQRAPSHPGVQNMGGDMFVNVPKADAVFMKWICHDWSDTHCEKLLKNCYEAVPEKGKVIIAETILPEDLHSGPSTLQAAQSDVFMLAVNPGGKERSEKEFEALAKQAGFKKLVKVCCAFNVWVMEFHK